jgi:hypothetical protein
MATMEGSQGEQALDKPSTLGALPGGSSGAGKRVLGVATLGQQWKWAAPEDLARTSPLLALRAYLGVPWQPYIVNIQSTFTQGGPTILDPVSWEDSPTTGRAPQKVDQFMVCDRMVFEIDAPNAGDGAFLKGLNDFFYARNSGIQAIMDVLGRPKYAVAPYFTPIASLCAMINEDWPHGWVFEYGQAARMQFQAFSPIPSFPTTITVTFRLWTPVGGRFRTMTEYEAAQELTKVGIDCGKTDWASY